MTGWRWIVDDNVEAATARPITRSCCLACTLIVVALVALILWNHGQQPRLVEVRRKWQSVASRIVSGHLRLEEAERLAKGEGGSCVVVSDYATDATTGKQSKVMEMTIYGGENVPSIAGEVHVVVRIVFDLATREARSYDLHEEGPTWP